MTRARPPETGPEGAVKRLLFVQNGDFRDAYRRFAAGGAETYRDQRKSVDFVAALAPAACVHTLAFGPEDYHEALAVNLSAGGRRRAALDAAGIARLFDEIRPSHVILRTPHPGLLREACRRQLHLLPVFADIFEPGGLRAWLRNRTLRRLLLRALGTGRAPCISNHSLNASRSLVATLGLPPGRIVPWDWSAVPLSGPAKPGLADPGRPTAFFAGKLSEDKGLGDCLEALALLRRAGIALSLTCAGGGDTAPWQARAAALGLAGQVRFLGMIPNAEVRAQMRRHDFVLVPSRHSYPEGLPNTIYEGLASRSVLVISDHPAFAGRLRPGEEALQFPAARPEALARTLTSAIADGALCARISENAERALANLYVGMEWTALVRGFLEDPADATGWVAPAALPALDRVAGADR